MFLALYTQWEIHFDFVFSFLAFFLNAEKYKKIFLPGKKKKMLTFYLHITSDAAKRTLSILVAHSFCTYMSKLKAAILKNNFSIFSPVFEETAQYSVPKLFASFDISLSKFL